MIGMTDKSYQPTIAGLRAFVAVAEKQHFGSAATTLGVSQSTLSQALSALETGLGVQLVERSTRRVFLTDEGRQLLPHAQAVIEHMNEDHKAAMHDYVRAFFGLEPAEVRLAGVDSATRPDTPGRSRTGPSMPRSTARTRGRRDRPWPSPCPTR